MKEYNNLNRAAQKEINILAGTLNLPEVNDYSDLATFLHDIRSRIVESSYLISQANKLLNNGE